MMRFDQRGCDAVLYLGSIPPFCSARQHPHLKRVFYTALAQVDIEDLCPLILIRQADKEDLIETALANEFSRQQIDAVGCCRYKDHRLLLLHPGKEGGEDPRGRTGRALFGPYDSGLYLVYP